MARVADEPTLVLHTRAYRNTSMIIDMFTLNHGRRSAVHRAARSNKLGNRVQPFAQFLAGWYGKGQMVTLTTVENLQTHWLSGNRGASAYYVVELIVRLVKEAEPIPQTFVAACVCIQEIANGVPPVQALRAFEQRLLQDLGYGVDFTQDARSGLPIAPTEDYQIVPAVGFVQLDAAGSAATEAAAQIRGSVLAAIAAGDYSSVETCAAAKQIFGRSIAILLDGQELHSRRLLRAATDPALNPGAKN